MDMDRSLQNHPKMSAVRTEIYEVEDILADVTRESDTFFLIKWKGYSHEYNTWEPVENLCCYGLLSRYLKNKMNNPKGRYAVPRKSKIERFVKKQITADVSLYEVEKILGMRQVGRTVEYFVQWKGYPAEENSWEPQCNVCCPQLIKDFHDQNKARVLHTNSIA